MSGAAIRGVVFGLVLASAGACQSSSQTAMPAVLSSGDAETLAQVKAVLSDALGRARINFGAGDPTQQPQISVLPPPITPPEQRSLARPEIFDLVLIGELCYAVRRTTGDRFVLEGVSCQPAP